jgi:hypothetical protein
MDSQPVDGGQQAAVPELWVSISKLALIKNVSKQAISKRVKKFESDGLIRVLEQDGEKKINLVEFDRLIGANTDPAQALRNPGGIAQPSMPLTAAPPAADQADLAKPQYSASRALRESYDAENSRLDLEERLKRLVDKQEAEQRIFRIFRRARDRFLSLSAVAAPRIFNAPDERTARQIMDEEVRNRLLALADDIDAAGDIDVNDDAEEVSDAADGERRPP